MWYGNLVGDEIHPVFHNEKGYWGVNFPTKSIESRQTLFTLIQPSAQGLYVGMNDPTQPYLMEWTFEQHPASCNPSATPSHRKTPYLWPACLSPVPHLPFRLCPSSLRKNPGARRRSRLRRRLARRRGCLQGMARNLVHKQPRFPDMGETFIPGCNCRWMELKRTSPSLIASLPEYGRWSARTMVSRQFNVGWNHGGQDGGDPSLNTDPAWALGTNCTRRSLHSGAGREDDPVRQAISGPT